MLKFIKENSYDIFKLILNQIAVAVFGIIMSAATHQNFKLNMAITFFGIALYLVLTYLSARTVGERDYAPVKAGRKPATPFKGLFIGIAANALNLICGILIFICSFYLVYQPQAKIIDKNNNDAEVYICTANNTTTVTSETGNEIVIAEHVAADTLKKVNLYSNHSDTLYTYDYKENGRTVKVYENKSSGHEALTLYDANGDRIDLFGRPESANINRGNLDSWANAPYSISFTFCTFLQIIFVPINNELLGGAQWFFMLTPVLPIFMSAIGYYLSSNGKRLFPFIPERSMRGNTRFRL